MSAKLDAALARIDKCLAVAEAIVKAVRLVETAIG